MIEDIKTKLNIPFLTISVLLHFLVLALQFDSFDFNWFKSPKKTSIKLKNIRVVGVKDSKKKDLRFLPSKKTEDIFKKFNMTKASKDYVSTKSSSISKKAIAKKESKKKRVNYLQQKMMNEVVQQQSKENPLFNNMNYNVKFVPPKGISPDELNELEKVFYSFFRRVAIKYIDSAKHSFLQSVDKKPYVRGILKKHKPARLTATIKYDKEGNAQVIRITKSSYEDEVHRIFEKTLQGMDKIPNIAKSLIDKDDTYTAHFSLDINVPQY